MSGSGPSRRPPGAGRELVIRAARDLFARRGYDGTSLRDIAERAGVNESVIYRSVGTKEQIFNAAVLDFDDRVNDPCLINVKDDPLDSSRSWARRRGGASQINA